MDILIAGVGGQGTLLASRVLGKYALKKNLDVKLSEVHGMAQRGGSVITFVRFGDKVNSPIIDEKGADIILAFEKLEALRYAHYLADGGKIIYSTQEIMPMPVVTGAAKYPDDIESRLPNAVGIDAMDKALKAGNAKAANSVMLGALTAIMGLDKAVMEEALTESVPEKLVQLNLKAFGYGCEK